MKIILSIVGFVYLFYSSAVAQTNACPISGNLIGKSSIDLTVFAIELGENENYVMKTYDLQRNLLNKCRGKWNCINDILQLNDESGSVIFLRKYTNTWYRSDKEGKTCLVRFNKYQNQDDFWEEFFQEGC